VIPYAGSRFEEMDTDAVLRRRPAVALVDEFAHTNVPGSERLKRWQDVHALLEAGIDVLTTMNVQHLESLNDEVWHVTGIRVRETIPDWVVDEADEVVLVDLTPNAVPPR
jgi:two-component system sensor histidine kinase KdpD